MFNTSHALLFTSTLLKNYLQDLEYAQQQKFTRTAATLTVYIVLLQLIATSFGAIYKAKIEETQYVHLQQTEHQENTKDGVENLCVSPTTVVNMLRFLRVILTGAFYVCIIIIFIGVFDLTKTVADVRPSDRGDPVVL